MSNNEGPVSEVIQTCDRCKFITYGYKCSHPDAPPDSDLLVSENGDETYTPNWCPIGKHEMVAVRKDDILDDSEMKEILELLFQWDSEHGRGPLNPVIRKLEEIVKRKEEQ